MNRDPAMMGVWDDAYDRWLEANPWSDVPDSSDRQDFAATFAEGAEWGAGWMAALIGMGEAIRARH